MRLSFCTLKVNQCVINKLSANIYPRRSRRCIVNHGLESSDRRVVHETLISVPILFPPDFDSRYGNKNLYLLVPGLARRLVEADTRMAAFLSMMKISDVVGTKTFSSYITKLTPDQKKVARVKHSALATD